MAATLLIVRTLSADAQAPAGSCVAAYVIGAEDVIDRITVLRQEGTETRRIRFRYESLANDDGGKGENFCVTPGDIILVP